MSNNDSLLYRLALARIKGINLDIARDILQRCGSEAEFFGASAASLADRWRSLSPAFSQAARQEALKQAQAELDFIVKGNVRAVYFTDPEYPQRLLGCADAPPMLFACGSASLNPEHALSIVGTRHATAYGVDFTTRAVNDLKAANPVIVSGLAYGIDIAAHKAALDAGVATVAVVAHGLSTIYPAAHRRAAAQIVEQGGAIVTEYFSSDPVHRGNFLARNRIVAALSDGVLVVESDTHGGALSTARTARRYGRTVMAAPGRATDRFSRGCNALIANQQARCVTDGNSIAELLGWPLQAPDAQLTLFSEPQDPLTADEQTIVNYLTANGSASASELHTLLPGLPTRSLMATLVDLEFRGHIAALPGSRYAPLC